MAKVKMGALVEEISGSIGQLVFSKWKGLHYARYKAATVMNPMSEYQAGVRNCLATSTQLWWSLTDIQRALWEEYAQGQGRARADEKAVGSKNLIKPRGILQSGFNAFIGANVVTYSIDQSRVLIPSTKAKPPGILVEKKTGEVSICHFTLGPPGRFDISVDITPLSACYADTYARVWIKGVWAGAHAYIAGLSDVWASGEMDKKTVTIPTIRMGSNGNMAEVPFEHCMYIKVQVDLADVLAETGPPSVSPITHCCTPGP